MKRTELLALLMFVGLSTRCQTHSYDPKPDIGYPAGLIPDCPGVMKNASISSGRLPQLQLVFYRLDVNGRGVRKPMSIMSAPKALMKEKYFDIKNKKTLVYFAGFWDSSFWPHSQAMAASYCRRGYNVIMTETFKFLTHIYPKSARLSRFIGKKIGEFLYSLTTQGLTADNIELVGTSLGAHVASYAAKTFLALTGRKISRLTGLDPAGPCFRTLPEHLRLNPNDAERVDVIHTNIDGFGMAEPLGHVDFYANGGEFQPGDIIALPCLVVCSHIKAILYWWQAIEHPKKFIGVQCDSVQDARYAKCYNSTVTNYLGLEAKFDKPGIFYLSTSNEYPYYRGKEGLKAENEIYTSEARKINSDDYFEA